MISFRDYISLLQSGDSLTEAQMREATKIMVSGEVDTTLIAVFLALQARNGITTGELKGAVATLLQKKKKFTLPDSINHADIVDCCGTGGDGKHTLNVSTAVAFVVAGAGVPVVKHGNRSVSSKSGSSDVLGALGVNVNASDDTMRTALEKANVCFLNAPNYHPAMKHVAEARGILKSRTIFNLIGPLVNPAEPTRQLVGVYDSMWLKPFAEVLATRDTAHAMIVHSHDGHDELSLMGNDVYEVIDGNVARHDGFPSNKIAANIAGGDAAYNATQLRNTISPAISLSHYYMMVTLNAAAVLMVSNKATTFGEATDMATHSIQSGAALRALDTLVEITSK